MSSSSSFFSRQNSLSLSRRPSLGGTRRVIFIVHHHHHHHHHHHLPFANPLFQTHNRFEFSAPRYYDFVSHSKNTKTRAKKDAKTAEMYFESEKPRGTTTTSRAKSIIIERRGSFTQILKEKETLGAHFLSFFLSFARARAPGAKTRGLPDVLLSILSFFLSLFLSLSPFSCCVRACFLSVLTPRLAVFRSVPSFR